MTEILKITLSKDKDGKYIPDVKINTEEYDEYTLINALLKDVQTKVDTDLMDEARFILFGEEPETDEDDEE